MRFCSLCGDRIQANGTDPNAWVGEGNGVACPTTTGGVTGHQPEATAVSTGYVCKRCGGPSPVGVGYATSAPRTGTVKACPCGYSVKESR